MTLKNPYEIVKHQHVTEKSKMLGELQSATSNPSVRRCESPKYVFIVHSKATKREIKAAVEKIYEEQKIEVVSVNTINVKGKVRRRRGKVGVSPSFKKAIVTLAVGDKLHEDV